MLPFLIIFSQLFFLTISQKANAEPRVICDGQSSNSATDMEYIDICKQRGECKKFSRLVMGTDHLIQSQWTDQGQPELTEEQAFAVLDEAVKNGINFFDTSPIYVGAIEQRLGKWKELRKSIILGDSFYHQAGLNPDRKLYVLSKGGFPFDLFWSNSLPKGNHSEELVAELWHRGMLAANDKLHPNMITPLSHVIPGSYASRLNGSRDQITERVLEEIGHTHRNLNGDITIYLMHRDDNDAVDFKVVERPQTPVKTIMEALSDRRVSDQFWMAGWSNWKTSRVNESIKIAQENAKLLEPVINSPYFSLFEMSERTIHALGVQVTHKEMMDPQFQRGIKIMPYSPLGGFSILDKPEPQWENAKKSAKEKYDQGDAYWKNVYPAIFTKANEARWYRVLEFTKKFNSKNCTNYSVDQMINAYVLAHPRVDLLAVGPITKEQVQRTVQSLKLSKMLTASDLNYLYSGVREN